MDSCWRRWRLQLTCVVISFLFATGSIWRTFLVIEVRSNLMTPSCSVIEEIESCRPTFAIWILSTEATPRMATAM